MHVKLLLQDGEVYVFAESVDRVAKECAMRRRQLKWLWKRLRELAAMEISRDDMLIAHIFIAFLAYCLQVTLQRRL